MKPIHPIVRTGILLAAAISAPASAATTPISWTGATDTIWATGTNWTGGVAPADDLASHLAVFSQATYTSQPDAETRSVAGVVIGNGTLATAPLEIVGDALTLGASGIEMKANAGAASLDTPIFLGADQTWRNDSTNLLSTIELNGQAGAGDNDGFLLTTDGSGPISLGRAMTGTGGLVKNGSGTLTLAAAHAFTGPTTVNAGVLEFGEVTTGTMASAITNNTTIRSNSTGTQTLSGAISGPGALVKDGSGTLILAAVNTYTGTTTVNAGTLQVNAPNNTGLLPAASATTVNSGGTLKINSATSPNPHYITPAISLNGGTLNYAASGGGKYFGFDSNATSTNQVSVAAESVINLTSTAAGGNFHLDAGLSGSANLTVNANTNGAGLVLRSGNNSGYSGTMTVNGNPTGVPNTESGLGIGGFSSTNYCNMPNASFTINGTLELGNQNVGTNASMGWASGSFVSGVTFQMNSLAGTGLVTANMQNANSTRTLSVGNNNGGGDFSGQIVNGANNVLSLIKTGTGTQILSGDNNFTGTTTVNGGTLRLNHQNALKASVYNTASTGTLVFGSEVVGNAFTVGGLTGSGNLALVNSDAAAIALTAGGTVDSTYTGQLTGAGSLTKAGTGTLTLGGTSSHSGATTVSDGKLNLTGNLTTSDLSSGGTGVLGGEGTAKSITFNGGILDVDASTPGALTAANGLSITAPVVVSLSKPPVAPGPIPILKYSGTFTGNLSDFILPSGGTRTYVLSNTAGTISLDLGAANRTWGGATAVWEVAGGSTAWVEGDQKFYNNDIVTFPDPVGAKTVTLSGTLQPASTTVTTTGANSYAFNFTSGNIAGAGSFTKSGNGTATFSGTGANTFTGVVNANGGILSSSAATTATGSFLGGIGSATARRTVNIASGAQIKYDYTTANGFLNLGANYGAFHDFNISGTLAIYDGAAVSQILQSTFNLSNGGEIANTGVAHTGAYGLLFGWNGVGGGNINVTGTGNKITADRIGFFNGATVTTSAGADLTISSIVKNGNTTASTLTKAGAGTLVLTATGSSYTGATTVTAGTLKVNGTKTGAGAVTVATTGTLGGSGTITGATTVQSGGTLAPGDGVGTTAFASTVDLQAGSTYVAEIGSTGNDKVTATTLTANGTIKVTLVGGYSPATGTTFDLADGTIAGTPAFDFSAAVLPTGLSWDTTSFATDGTIKVTGTATGSPYDTWATANGVTGGKAGDDDNDGISNQLEFATAANPQSGSSRARVYPLAQLIGGQKVLTYTVAVRAGATFAANGSKQQADKDGVRYVVEGSDQLGTWNTVVVTELAPADATAVQAALGSQLNGLDPAWQWHSFRTDGDLASDPSDYIRLSVSDAP